MLATKDSTGFLAPLAPHASLLVATPIASSQAARDPAELAAIARTLGLNAQTAPTLVDAVQAAAQRARRVLICGSLYLAGEVLAMSGGVT
jgi:dihydrofolate synthase/folylpolyglutamate synthase